MSDRDKTVFENLLIGILAGIKMAFTEIKSHKLRSILSITGVLLGVASLTITVTLLNGVNRFISKQTDEWVGYVRVHNSPSINRLELLRNCSSPSLRFSDGDFLKGNQKEIKNYNRIIERQLPVSYKSYAGRMVIQGVDAPTIATLLLDCKVNKTQIFEPEGFNAKSTICFISQEFANRIGGGVDLLGKKILIAGTYYGISGIYTQNTKKVNTTPINCVFIPLEVMKKNITGEDPRVYSLSFDYSPVSLNSSLRKTTELLKARHRGVTDFQFQLSEWIAETKAMLYGISSLFILISVISLFVGGMSIMNVTLSSISERIKEIGIKKALGASNAIILIQFISESVTLSLLGGIIGMFVGLIPLQFKNAISQSTYGVVLPAIDGVSIVLILCVIVIIGIVFGVFPAIKASKMNPINALTYE